MKKDVFDEIISDGTIGGIIAIAALVVLTTAKILYKKKKEDNITDI